MLPMVCQAIITLSAKNAYEEISWADIFLNQWSLTWLMDSNGLLQEFLTFQQQRIRITSTILNNKTQHLLIAEMDFSYFNSVISQEVVDDNRHVFAFAVEPEDLSVMVQELLL